MKKLNFENSDFVCFTQDKATEEALLEALTRLGESSFKVYQGNVGQALEFLKSPSRTKILCVDCLSRDLLISDVEGLMEFCPPDTQVIILGEKNDVSIFRDLVKLHITDYLVKPVSPDILLRCFGGALKQESKSKDNKKKRSGKVVLFIGSVGGVGTTTVATNTAAILAEEMGKKVVLFDADLQFGSVNTLLDLKSSHLLRDAIESPERMDDVFLEQSMGTFRERLRIISAEEPLHENFEMNRDHLANLDTMMNLITSKFHYVVVDLCRHHPMTWQYFNRHAQFIFVLSGLSIPSLRDTLRILGTLSEDKESKTHAVILNHVHESHTIQKAQFEEQLGRPIDSEIFYNSAAFEAADLGVPLAFRSPSFRSDIDNVIEVMTGITARKNQAPFLTKFVKSITGR